MHKDLSSNPQHSRKKVMHVVLACNPSEGEAETGGALEPGNLAEQVNSWFRC